MPDGLTGSLVQWPLGDLLEMLLASRQAGRVEVTNGPQRADIFLEAGAVVHASMAGTTGEDVLMEAMGWDRGIFSFASHVAAPAHSITSSIADVRDRRSVRKAELDALTRIIPSVNVCPQPALFAPSGPVTLEPREWQVIVRADGHRDIAAIARDLGSDEIEIMKVFKGLVLRELVSVGKPPSAASEPEAPRLVLVHPTFFQHLEHEAAAALGPLVGVIVDDAVDAMGFARSSFPRDQASRLVEMVGTEIQDDARRVKFQQGMLAWMQSYQRSAAA